MSFDQSHFSFRTSHSELNTGLLKLIAHVLRGKTPRNSLKLRQVYSQLLQSIIGNFCKDLFHEHEIGNYVYVWRKWQNNSSHIDSVYVRQITWERWIRLRNWRLMTRAFPWRPLCELYVCEITLSFLWTLYPWGCGKDPHKQTRPRRGNTFTTTCRPKLTPVKSCLAVLRPFTHTHTHTRTHARTHTHTHTSPVPIHLLLHFILSACGCVKILVCVCCELDFLFCTLWETDMCAIVY